MRTKRALVVLHVLFPTLMCVLAGCIEPTKQIQSPHHEVRNRAINRLAKKAAPADLDALHFLLLNHESERVRSDCARALGYIQNSQSVPFLIEALNNRHWLVRRSAVGALGGIGDPRATAPLLEMFSDKEPEIQRVTASAFQRLKSPEAVPLLVSRLRDSNPENLADIHDMNREALRALAHQAAKRSLPAAARMLDYPYTPVARDAADAVGAIVGKEFKEDVWIAYGFMTPLGSPSKARQWLQEHPEAFPAHENNDKKR